MFDPTSSSVDPALPLESEVNKVVGPIQSSIDPTLPLESEVDTAQVLLVTLYFSEQGGISPISTKPHPNTEVISFHYNILMELCLPSYLHFQIIVQVCDKITLHGFFFTKVLLSAFYPQLLGKLWVPLSLCQ